MKAPKFVICPWCDYPYPGGALKVPWGSSFGATIICSECHKTFNLNVVPDGKTYITKRKRVESR